MILNRSTDILEIVKMLKVQQCFCSLLHKTTMTPMLSLINKTLISNSGKKRDGFQFIGFRGRFKGPTKKSLALHNIYWKLFQVQNSNVCLIDI